MKKLFVIGLILLVSGCIIHVNSYVKPDVDFSKIKKIAVVKFALQDTQPLTKVDIELGLTNIESYSGKETQQRQSISQMVNDMVIMAFANKGLNIIEKAQFTESERQALLNEGIEAIIYGTVFTSKKGDKISLSLKMFDLKNNRLIWSASIIEEYMDELGEITKRMVNTIP